MPPISYVVKENDNLIKIAELHSTNWQRIYDKNSSISHPDKLNINQNLVIPTPEETLVNREIPQSISNTLAENLLDSTASSQETSRGNPGDTNSYEPGQCTWHVKNLAPWVSNVWGNASNWSSAARASGYSTNSQPIVGAVAWRSGHVAYVKAVNGNQVLVSEMNYDWTPYHQREIWVSATSYKYIY